MPSMTSPTDIARSLSEAQRRRVTDLWPGENRMGGFGSDSDCPGLIKRVGIIHPCFGSHYCLTPLGEAVRAAIIEEGKDA